MTSVGSTSIGTTLLMLASFISTPVTIGVGIYCLKKGGVPVEAITSNMGNGLLICLKRAAQGLQYVTQGAAHGICIAGTAAWDNLVNIVGDIITREFRGFEIDDSSVESQSTAATRASIASVDLRNLYLSVEQLIEKQESPIDFSVDNLLEFPDLPEGLRAPPGSPRSQLGSPRSPLTQDSVEFDLESQQKLPKRQRRDEDGPGGATSGFGGGRKKTRRNKKSKKCKKGGKRNKTKKHHKTLKRCKSKMKH
jgi:hypothetical protein